MTIRVPIMAIRVPTMAIRVPIMAIRVPIMAIRVLGTGRRRTGASRAHMVVGSEERAAFDRVDDLAQHCVRDCIPAAGNFRKLPVRKLLSGNFRPETSARKLLPGSFRRRTRDCVPIVSRRATPKLVEDHLPSDCGIPSRMTIVIVTIIVIIITTVILMITSTRWSTAAQEPMGTAS